MYKNLKNGQMIIEDNIDEIDLLKTQNYFMRFSNQAYGLTLAPTMKCNFDCPYCYEKGHNLHTMSSETVTKVKEFIRNLKVSTKKLSIAWYGGEPLLAFDIIKDISKTAIEEFGEEYEADMVTNGYLLSKRIIEQLKELRIHSIQVTIDGPPDIHNKSRKLPNGGDTFFVILNNLSMIKEIVPDVDIAIRVNTDKTNIGRVDEILEYLDQYHLNDKVNLYLAPIDNINGTCNASSCFSNNEFAEEQMDFIKRNYKKGYNFINIPDANLYICGAVAGNSCIIDAEGDFYKCWDDVGRKEYRAGNLDEGLGINTNVTQWLSYEFMEEECKNCAFLPACMGGCPNHNIRLGEKRCAPIRENAEQMVRFMYEVFS